jgi:ubiquinone/menaquinone biosynthesis C-methylase UbiE
VVTVPYALFAGSLASAQGETGNLFLARAPRSARTERGLVAESAYGEAYFEGRDSNYWWTVGRYENLRRSPHWEEMLQLIRQFKENGRLLDVGCSYGFLVNKASKHFESYGIDISSFAVKKSKEHCKGSVSRASAVNLPFKDESFDVMTLVDTLEHIPDYKECLKDVVRTLKKRGILLLQLPNPLIWAHICARIGLDDETHMNNFRLEQWQRILLENGFKIEKCFGFIAYAFNRIRFFAKSEKAASLFPELWIIAKKKDHGF